MAARFVLLPKSLTRLPTGVYGETIYCLEEQHLAYEETKREVLARFDYELTDNVLAEIVECRRPSITGEEETFIADPGNSDDINENCSVKRKATESPSRAEYSILKVIEKRRQCKQAKAAHSTKGHGRHVSFDVPMSPKEQDVAQQSRQGFSENGFWSPEHLKRSEEVLREAQERARLLQEEVLGHDKKRNRRRRAKESLKVRNTADSLETELLGNELLNELDFPNSPDNAHGDSDGVAEYQSYFDADFPYRLQHTQEPPLPLVERFQSTEPEQSSGWGYWKSTEFTHYDPSILSSAQLQHPTPYVKAMDVSQVQCRPLSLQDNFASLDDMDSNLGEPSNSEPL
ncbi:hypothetical protein UCRPC4_g05414 [Phaeomoniella chlamydospora]|uniref:Uncharacterized protein n=1 Tax=Phaeomoniella chlamydospora TaxID=158046 RepID=A0A0G2E609_PHACM|nr:hypothetical protein UCRPC4_g05414 [Phaeomoniella chlamydospora]